MSTPMSIPSTVPLSPRVGKLAKSFLVCLVVPFRVHGCVLSCFSEAFPLDACIIRDSFRVQISRVCPLFQPHAGESRAEISLRIRRGTRAHGKKKSSLDIACYILWIV